LPGNLAREFLSAAYCLTDYCDILTGLELVRRGKISGEQLDSYVNNYTNRTIVDGDKLISSLDFIEESIKNRTGLNKDQLKFFPESFLLSAQEVGLDIEDFLKIGLENKKSLPTAYDLERTIYEGAVVVEHNPGATDRMTFALFFDGYNEGHEGWHYAMIVGLDEHISSEDGIKDLALNLGVLMPTFSKELFPNEEEVVKSLKKNQLTEYPEAPILEIKSHESANFVKYHLIAEKVRERKKELVPGHPLNFL